MFQAASYMLAPRRQIQEPYSRYPVETASQIKATTFMPCESVLSHEVVHSMLVDKTRLGSSRRKPEEVNSIHLRVMSLVWIKRLVSVFLLDDQ